MSALTSLVRQVQIVSAVIPAYTHSSHAIPAYPYNTILLVDMVHTFHADMLDIHKEAPTSAGVDAVDAVDTQASPMREARAG